MIHLLPSLALAGAVIVAYGNSFGGVFQFDDFNVIVGNPAVHSWQAWLADAPTGIRPLLKFSYMVNWTWGVGTFGFHLLNTLIQAVNAILIYHLSRKFLENLPSPSPKAAAFACALIFALHPAQTEAVTYISGRSTSLMAMFYLASLLAYAHGRDQNNRWLLYLASPLLFILAVLTKETAVTLPLALLLWERTRESNGPWKTTLRNLGVHAGLVGMMAFAFAAHRGYSKFFEACFRTRGWEENLLTQINALPHLFSRLFLFPSLNIDPDLPLVLGWNFLVLSQALLLAALISLGLTCLRRRPSLGFGLLWFFIHLLPTNSFIPRLDIANDRQLYLASWGLFLAFSSELERIAGYLKPGSLLPAAATPLLAFILCLSTMARNEVYQSEVALWEDTAQKSPHKARVHNNLGYAYYLSGRYGEAERSYLTALRLKPDDSLARNNLTHLENLRAKKG
jgi:tetratricopeptide (TPR) repeat protein